MKKMLTFIHIIHFFFSRGVYLKFQMVGAWISYLRNKDLSLHDIDLQTMITFGLYKSQARAINVF